MPAHTFHLRRKILSWYQKNKRDLPWRRTNNPYYILVSEVMLQQTQVLRVLPKYVEFIETFPTIDILANAPLSEILKLWSGLGYNRRAKYLKQMAETVKNYYNSQIPDTYEELIQLPGIGDYTANAVLCFAFKQKCPAIDTNVRNVIEYELNKNQPLSSTKVKEFLLKLMPKEHPGEFLHALMDYSSLQLARPKRNRVISKPFKLSNRFLRGKLISRLTQKPFQKQELINEVQHSTKRSAQDIRKSLKEILYEELAIEKDGFINLP